MGSSLLTRIAIGGIFVASYFYFDSLYLFFSNILERILFELTYTDYIITIAVLLVFILIMAGLVIKNRLAIKHLSYMNYLTEDECNRLKEETTKREMSKLYRNPKFLELKAREEKNLREADLLSITDSEDEESDLLSKSNSDSD